MSDLKIIYELNHSAAHVLAQAIIYLYPHAKLTIGPVIDEGFYYDIDFGATKISSKNFGQIKQQMQRIIKQNLAFTSSLKSKTELRKFYHDNPYKLELIEKLEGNELNVVYTGKDFFDLCNGAHVQFTKEIKAFEILKTSCAYWRGDAKKPALTRIYGVAFGSKESLSEHLAILEYREQYDHRKLGAELNIFDFDPIIGAGLPMWLENGTIVRKLITKFINDIQTAHGVEMVTTPILATKKLYEKSGHWEHYRENMFPTMKVEESEYILRPMTCPHHIMLYKKQLWSYKQLPKIYGENAILHRYEHSGGLSGLERVRAMELIDNHAIIRYDQIQSVVNLFYNIIKTAMNGFKIKHFRTDLSLRDPNNQEKFFANDEMWNNAQSQLENVLKSMQLNYVPMVGEAAFYGPKIDFQMETISKRVVTVSTIQLDFLLPQRFEMEYVDQSGLIQRPILVHLGIIGTLERFIALLLEQCKGVLPFWLQPTQVVIIPIDLCKHEAAANHLQKKLSAVQLRVIVDNKEERLGKKIRFWQMKKVAYQIVIGDEEMNDLNTINYRQYGSEKSVKITYKEFVAQLQELNQQPPIKI